MKQKAHHSEQVSQCDAISAKEVTCMAASPQVYLKIILSNMKRRCLDPNHESYRFYGGATPPVRIYPSWLDPATFVKDVLEVIGPRPSDAVRPNGLSIWEFDRINSYGNYEPGNVRWLHYLKNQANKRRRVTKPRPRKETMDVGLPYYLTNSNGVLILKPGMY